jgi:Bacterial TniB protein
MSMGKLLNEVTQLRSASDTERLAFLRKKQIIMYPKMTALLDELSGIIDGDNPEENYRAIYARSFNGKSTHAKQLLKRYPLTFNPLGDAAEMPVVLISMPPKPSLRELCFRILRAIGEPMHAKAEGDHVISCAYQSLITLKTRALVIDEFQHIGAGAPSDKQPVVNLIKEIGEHCKLAVFAFGVPSGVSIIENDVQLANRFEAMSIEPWRSSDEETRQILQMFEYMLPLRKESNVACNPEVIERIIALADGMFGHIRKIMYAAAATAIRSGRECIDARTLDDMRDIQAWLPSVERKEAVILATGAKKEDFRPGMR